MNSQDIRSQFQIHMFDLDIFSCFSYFCPTPLKPTNRLVTKRGLERCQWSQGRRVDGLLDRTDGSLGSEQIATVSSLRRDGRLLWRQLVFFPMFSNVFHWFFDVIYVCLKKSSVFNDPMILVFLSSQLSLFCHIKNKINKVYYVKILKVGPWQSGAPGYPLVTVKSFTGSEVEIEQMLGDPIGWVSWWVKQWAERL